MSIVWRSIEWSLKGKNNFVTNGDIAPTCTVRNTSRLHHYTPYLWNTYPALFSGQP